MLWGDQLMILYAREILTRKPGATFIGEVKCSQLMYDDIAARGGHPIMWKTGHSLIKAKMKETRAELAGEMSGHMFFADRYLRFRRRPLRRLPPDRDRGQFRAAPLHPPRRSAAHRHHPRNPLRLPRRNQVRRGPRWPPPNCARNHKTVDVDGVRVLFPEGWGLVRASNTQPVLVMRFEATTPDLLAQYRREVEEVVERSKRQAQLTASH